MPTINNYCPHNWQINIHSSQGRYICELCGMRCDGVVVLPEPKEEHNGSKLFTDKQLNQAMKNSTKEMHDKYFSEPKSECEPYCHTPDCVESINKELCRLETENATLKEQVRIAKAGLKHLIIVSWDCPIEDRRKIARNYLAKIDEAGKETK